MSPSVPTGAAWQTASQTVIPVHVSIGGTDAQVWYAGVTPGYTGLYQVNVQIPDGTPAGAQPLVVTENGVDSNTVTVAVQ